MARRRTPSRAAAPGECWITVRVPESAYAQLQATADTQERSVSWIVRKMILAALHQDRAAAQSADEGELT